jgi:hypothetical protein
MNPVKARLAAALGCRRPAAQRAAIAVGGDTRVLVGGRQRDLCEKRPRL